MTLLYNLFQSPDDRTLILCKKNNFTHCLKPQSNGSNARFKVPKIMPSKPDDSNNLICLISNFQKIRNRLQKMSNYYLFFPSVKVGTFLLRYFLKKMTFWTSLCLWLILKSPLKVEYNDLKC